MKKKKKINQVPQTGDPFLDSLYEFSPAPSENSSSVQKKRNWIPPLLRWGALAICLVVLTVSLTSIFKSVAGYKSAGEYYDSLSDIWKNSGGADGNLYGILSIGSKDQSYSSTVDYAGAQNGDGSQDIIGEENADSETLTYIKAKLNALRAQNSDLAGWITIPNTRIDYPVVHTTDNEYYLTHSFDHSFLQAGTIFIDYRNSKNLSENYNTVIYGHNMLSGAMFSCVSDFFSRTYFNENRYIYIYTDDGIYVYKTFSIFKVKINKDSSYIDTYFATGEDFVAFANRMKANSVVKVDDIDFNENDRIITLSTCTNAHNTEERYCMQAKLVSIQK